jgi:hypothetical protein
LAKSYRLLHINTTVACRTRLYTTAANQTADLGRPLSTDPAQGAGVMLDFDTLSTFLVADLSPMVDGSSMESTPSTSIPITINLNAAGPTTVTFTYIQTE